MANDRETPPAADPIALTGRLIALLPRLTLAMSQAGHRHLRELTGLDYSLIDYQGVFAVGSQFALRWWLKPLEALQAQTELVVRSLSIIEQQHRGGSGLATSRSSADKRFLDTAWNEDPVLRVTRELYLLYSDWLTGQLRNCPTLSEHDRQKLAFYVRQLLSALAPTNAPFVNPKIRARALETNGESLIKGLENLLHDLEEGRGLFPITQNDPYAFEVGRNLAVTTGKVVYRNDLMELIQYAPRTDTVFRTPLLFVPPWINKYYILDLQPENSLLRWLIERGHTVFVISWANPNERHASKGFEHYLREGPLEAIDVVRRVTDEDEINLGGFCIGGILAVCVLAYLWAGSKAPIRSALCLATMIDLSSVGDAAVFIDEAQLWSIERHARLTGFLEGEHMKDMFSMMRENDLIWSYVISNYLLGRAPPAFDILHWNADSTRLPARMLTDFLRDIYMENSLIKPGFLRLGGRPIDLTRIRTPCYFLSTIEDHIAPWKATYPASQILSGPVQFVLGGSGHIAGVINPPSKNKYAYWTADRYPDCADEWLHHAEKHKGSWWSHCAAWLVPYGGEKVAARQPGSNEFSPLADAPGHYVLQQ
jgi:poly[(R)-3-hydroxyalkanoate] polymerase subunit PhaC